LPSFLSIYWKDVSYIADNSIKKRKEIWGLMTSRPIHVEFLNSLQKGLAFDVYYVDYLCVKKDKRKRNIAPQIIQTHEYNQRHQNQSIKVSLFKREEEITGIIPLCIYSNHLYLFDKLTKQKSQDLEYDIIRANKDNLYLILDFFKIIKQVGKYSIWIQCPFSSLLELIKTNNVMIFFIVRKKSHDILAIFFFRNSCIYVESKLVITCFASLFSNNFNFNKLSDMYYSCLGEINKDIDYGYYCIENVSENNRIIRVIKEKVLVKSVCAYFFYNYSYSTLSSNTCFICC
jgi:hypothetical protein